MMTRPLLRLQAHVGGLAVGGLVALLLWATRNLNQKTQQMLGLVGIFVLVLAVTYAGLYLRVLPMFGY